MTQPPADWDGVYREGTPPWSIGRPQPELAALVDRGEVRGDILDAGCGHAALSLALAARGYTVVGLDGSATAVAAASTAATEQGLTTATFAQADVTAFPEYPPGSEGRFATIVDSGLFHALPPESRQNYLRAIFSASAPGAVLHILAFASEAFDRAGTGARPGPSGLTETELREAVSVLWQVDRVRPAKVYGNAAALASGEAPFVDVEYDDDGHFLVAGFLLSAHKPR